MPEIEARDLPACERQFEEWELEFCRFRAALPELHVCTRRDGKVIETADDGVCWQEAKAQSDQLRFEDKYEVDADLGCWIWKGAIDMDGYGQFWNGARVEKAARWAYRFFVGSFDESLHIDHLCRNQACVNPDHLEPVTRSENLRRGIWPNATKTHCVNGHPFDEANTIWRVGSRTGRRTRACRACYNASRRKYRARRRADQQSLDTPKVTANDIDELDSPYPAQADEIGDRRAS